MKPLLLSRHTEVKLKHLIANPPHALLIIAPPGTGKGTVAHYIAGRLLGIDSEALQRQPYFRLLQPEAGKGISITEARDVIRFLTLRPAVSGSTTRVVIIEAADSLTVQAQNALLKTLEEPPAGTVLVMTAPSERSLLPTIRSRAQLLNLSIPPAKEVGSFFVESGYAPPAVDKALLMSGGLPGLMHALLEDDTAHPLFAATAAARDILQKTTFERLVLAEDLAKQRQLWQDTLFILGQMASTALVQGRGGLAAARRWHHVLAAVYAAGQQTKTNAQLKLVLLDFMLAL